MVGRTGGVTSKNWDKIKISNWQDNHLVSSYEWQTSNHLIFFAMKDWHHLYRSKIVPDYRPTEIFPRHFTTQTKFSLPTLSFSTPWGYAQQGYNNQLVRHSVCVPREALGTSLHHHTGYVLQTALLVEQFTKKWVCRSLLPNTLDWKC